MLIPDLARSKNQFNTARRKKRDIQLRAPPQKHRSSLSTSGPLYCAFRRCVHWDFIQLLEQTLLHIRGRGNKRDLQTAAMTALETYRGSLKRHETLSVRTSIDLSEPELTSTKIFSDVYCINT